MTMQNSGERGYDNSGRGDMTIQNSGERGYDDSGIGREGV